MHSGQQSYRNPLPLQAADPVMRRAAGFHDDLADLTVGKEALELGACQAMRAGDAPLCISLYHLKNRLCKIDRDGCSIHAGLLSLKT